MNGSTKALPVALPDSGDESAARRRSPLLFVAAVFLAVAIFPLLFVGAGVTSKDAGMAYPDWPTSGGHLINPPGWWQVEATRWEHGHRLIGWVVGMTAIVVTVLGHRAGGTVRTLAWLALGAIVAQGVLGGVRVREISTPLAMVHGVFGQLCFCLAACTALAASPSWDEQRARLHLDAGEFLQRLAGAAVVVTFLQLLSGALLRHFLNNLALVLHLLWALVVMILVGWVSIWLASTLSAATTPGKFGRALGVLLAAQLVLGVATFIVIFGEVTAWPMLTWFLPSAHTAVGALLLMVTVVTRVSVGRMLTRDSSAATADFAEGGA